MDIPAIGVSALAGGTSFFFLLCTVCAFGATLREPLATDELIASDIQIQNDKNTGLRDDSAINQRLSLVFDGMAAIDSRSGLHREPF